MLIVSSGGKCTSSVGNSLGSTWRVVTLLLEGTFQQKLACPWTKPTAAKHGPCPGSRHCQALSMRGPSSSSQQWPQPGMLCPRSAGFELGRWRVGPVGAMWLCSVVTDSLVRETEVKSCTSMSKTWLASKLSQADWLCILFLRMERFGHMSLI